MPLAAGTGGAAAPPGHRQVELGHQAVGELAARGLAAQVVDPSMGQAIEQVPASSEAD